MGNNVVSEKRKRKFKKVLEEKTVKYSKAEEETKAAGIKNLPVCDNDQGAKFETEIELSGEHRPSATKSEKQTQYPAEWVNKENRILEEQKKGQKGLCLITCRWEERCRCLSSTPDLICDDKQTQVEKHRASLLPRK